MSTQEATTTPGEVRPTLRINPAPLKQCVDAGYQPIPLHRWNNKSEIGGKVRSDGKRPRDKDWPKRSYDTETVIAECVANNWNVGLRLKQEDLVVDIDPRNGGDESFERWCEEHGLDPVGWPCCRTGSGGRHYFLKKPPGFRIRGSLGKDFAGLEFKTAGQQVVAAGSIHPEAKQRYRWERPPLEPVDAPEAMLESIRKPEPTGETSKGGEYTPEQIGAMLERLTPQGLTHDEWWDIMASCHHASGGEAYDEFVAWSTSDPKFADDADIIQRRWTSLDAKKEGGKTFGTLRYYLHQADAGDAIPPDPNPGADFPDDLPDEAPGDAPSDVAAVEARGLVVKGNSARAEDTFMNALYAVGELGIDPALDVLSQTVVFRNPLWDFEYGDTFNDHLLRVARVKLSNRFQGNAYEPCEKNTYDAIMTLAFRNQFNPVLDYLASLTWDGVPRLPRLFTDYFPCGDDAYTRAVGLCFGIGAVRRQRQPGCKFDTMPFVLGPQGGGKSSGVEALFGSQFYSDAELGDLKNKDAVINLRGVWCHEFAELDSLKRSDAVSMKAFLSRGTDRQRDPYGRVAENHPRRWVAFGTGNEEGMMKDSTGGRRYWPLKLKSSVDVGRIKADRDQLWAEAAAREAKGESLTLPKALWLAAAERQDDQTTEDPWADVVRGFLADRARAWDAAEFETITDPYDEPRPPDRVHTKELLEALGIKPAQQTKDQAQRLRVVMVSVLGWHHKKNIRIGDTQGKGYAVTRDDEGST